MTKTALVSLCLALLPWSALAKPSGKTSASTPARTSLEGAEKQLGVPTKSGGIDIVADNLRAVLHPAALSSTAPEAVTAGHDPMEIRLVTAPKRTLKTKLGTVKSLGPAFATKVKVDGTKGAIVLVGKLPKDFELEEGQKVVTIAVFEAHKGKSKAGKPSLGVYPSIVGVFPSIVGLEAPGKAKATSTKGPSASVHEPYCGFGRPLAATSTTLFDFDTPLATAESMVSVKNPEVASKDDLGFFASKRIYLGPASATEDGVLGLVAAKGTLTEIGFGIVD